MKWQIPAKTFLLGEYAAIAGEAAILCTTAPCFELELGNLSPDRDIHPDSPAGRWWEKQGIENKGLLWRDPYRGRGGLGASSAQFIACYLAAKSLREENTPLQALLDDYYLYAWNGEGLRPSGYDIIAQSLEGCVYINHNKQEIQQIPWRFSTIGFLLIHTGKKLATHEHLQQAALPSGIPALTELVEQAKTAFDEADSQGLIDAINGYHQQLCKLNLVAAHSLEQINALKNDPRILAIKGCGAMGADVLLIIAQPNDLDAIESQLQSEGLDRLATHADIYKRPKNRAQ